MEDEDVKSFSYKHLTDINLHHTLIFLKENQQKGSIIRTIFCWFSRASGSDFYLLIRDINIWHLFKKKEREKIETFLKSLLFLVLSLLNTFVYIYIYFLKFIYFACNFYFYNFIYSLQNVKKSLY